MNCLFCKIIKGEIPSFKVYEDDLVIAFLDIHPRSNGHTLIIPKKHYTDFTELDSEIILHINMVAKNIVTFLSEKLDATGFNINTNYLDTQEIKHYHLHIIPSNKKKLENIEDVYNKLGVTNFN